MNSGKRSSSEGIDYRAHVQPGTETSDHEAKKHMNRTRYSRCDTVMMRHFQLMVCDLYMGSAPHGKSSFSSKPEESAHGSNRISQTASVQPLGSCRQSIQVIKQLLLT